MSGEVLIVDIVGLLKTPVGLESCGKSGVLCGSLLSDLIYYLCNILIPGDILYFKKIYVQIIDVGKIKCIS